MRLAIHGAAGRMGRAVARCALEAGCTLVGAADSAPGAEGRDVGDLAGVGPVGVAVSADVASALLGADVVIDFSHAGAVAALAKQAARLGVAVVSGTTRLEEVASRALDDAALTVPVLWSPNTSLGVFVLAELAREASARLGAEWDVEIVEVHHGKKTDAPSGTAVRLAEAVRSARADLRDVHGRSGDVGARGSTELGVHAVRGGDVIGDHTVHLLGPGERLELTHRATSRDLFARGALRCATWLAGKPRGRYGMGDVLGRA